MYNYVFFWSPEEYYEYAFKDIMNFQNVNFIKGIPDSFGPFLKTIHKIHHSAKINKFIRLPARKIWRYYYFKDKFRNNNPIVFIFHGNYYWMKSIGYFEFLKFKYPKCKCVLLLMDTVDSYKKYFKGKYYGDFEINYIKHNFDYVYTYNAIDAKKYGFEYYQSIYSSLKIKKQENPINDIFFIGKAKDRLSIIHSLYLQLKNKGFRCEFYIVDVEKEKQLNNTDIVYNKRLTYFEILQHISNSKGILEVVQGGTDGFTFRLDEALAYDKNIITNNTVINKVKYKNSPKIYFFDDNIINVDLDDYRRKYNDSYNYNNEYSPVNFLKKLNEI